MVYGLIAYQILEDPKVLIKFTAPKIDLTPAKCKEKMAKSTELPACAMFLDKGG